MRERTIRVSEAEQNILDKVNEEQFGGEHCYGVLIQHMANEAYGIDVPVIPNKETGVTF